MSWGGLNPALTAWRNAVMARFPDKDPSSDGARADSLHDSTSQHQEDPDGTVDAYDMDVNLYRGTPASGTPVELRLIEAMKLDFERDPHGRSQLWIHDREISNRDIGPWSERDYTGSNPHDKHVHWQSRQSREGDGRTWPMPNTDALLRELIGGDGMQDFWTGMFEAARAVDPAVTESDERKILARVSRFVVGPELALALELDERFTAIEALLTEIRDRLPAGPPADELH